MAPLFRLGPDLGSRGMSDHPATPGLGLNAPFAPIQCRLAPTLFHISIPIHIDK